MGGLAGHMYHLYDNPGLTFDSLKDIFKKAAAGKLVGTEKTDGQNIFISFSVRSGEAKAARNKGNIKDGGLNPEQLAQKFEGRGSIKDAFIEAFDSFELAVKRMNIEEQIDIFGPDANIYYNAEIQNPETANVIQYGIKTLNIHRVGHVEFDKHTGKETDRDLTRQFIKLEKYFKDTQNKINQSQYRVIANSVRNLEALTDQTALNTTLDRLSKLQNQVGVTDKDAIAQYLINVIDKEIDSIFPDMSIDTKKTLLKRMMKVKGITVITVLKTVPPDLLTVYGPRIKAFVENESVLYKTAIAPLEDIVHDFAVEMLRSLESAFVLDNKKEIERLRNELTVAKKAIESSSNEQAMEILMKQFNKIKNIENVTTAAEGFVFDYDGDTYKFTGNFAPLNQILGLFKYGRGSIPAMQKTLQEQTEITKSKSAVVVFGRFNPPTIGHSYLFKLALSIASQQGSDFYIVPTRTVDDNKNPLTFKEKIDLLAIMFPEYSQHIVDSDSVRDIIGVARYFSSLGYKELNMVAGSDRLADFDKIKKYNNSPDYSYEKINIISAGNRDPESESVSGMSSSKMRQAAIDGDLNKFMSGIAGTLDLEQAKVLLNTIRTRLSQKGAKRGQKIFLEPIAESLLKELLSMNTKISFKFAKLQQKTIDETSSMSAGSVEYSPIEKDLSEIGEIGDPNRQITKLGMSLQKRDDTQSKLYNIDTEEGKDMSSFMINRDDFIEEIKLRTIIRETLKKKINKKKQQNFKEEQEFRHIIRNILLESEEDMPHKSTGINVLEDVISGTMKILEKSFKMGQTTLQQRVSFRAHIINAVKNLLSFEKALEKPLEKDPALASIEADPKFIKTGKEKPAIEQDLFTIHGEDLTGRNLAQQAFDKIQKKIKEGYEILADQRDKDMYYEYLITNLKLYFDKWEIELQPTPAEPTTQSYENEKTDSGETSISTSTQQSKSLSSNDQTGIEPTAADSVPDITVKTT